MDLAIIKIVEYQPNRISNFIAGVLGNGESIRFWIDLWVGDSPLMFRWPSLFAIEKHKSCLVKHHIQDRGVSGSINWEWSRMPSTDPEFSELADSASLLSGIFLSSNLDKWKWTADESGSFSLKSFKELHQVQVDQDAVCLVKGCNWVPFKCRIFAWRAGLDRLPTKHALARRNILSGSDECALCQETSETVDHLFSGCWVALRVWSEISSWIKVPPIFAFSFKDLMEVYNPEGSGAVQKKIVRGIIIVGCWCIWRARNKKTFDNGKGEWSEIVGEVKSLSFFWFKNRSKYKK
ncbi:putative reverse transcriptase zinc-binding domain-containing protein [Helianthus annuus]|nr:putative reverse transcriptase zinc-binding domain-containing protein [Helianthus annuus]